MPDVIYPEESYAIQGSCFEVYREKGSGFLEAVYQECLAIEFSLRGVENKAQAPLSLSYKGHALQQCYRPDFLCFGRIIVELKAVSALTDEHRAQVLTYLRSTGMKLGLLVNFGHSPRLEYERFVL